MNKLLVFLTAIAIICFSACTAPAIDVSTCVEAAPSGFWMGVWHGIIAPVTFIISLFSDTIQMYDINNNGGWYDFGFVLGAGILFGGSGSKAKRRRRRDG
ncbi:MAG: hypothetical protein AAF587_23540 [Bacteroidota bacterium]